MTRVNEPCSPFGSKVKMMVTPEIPIRGQAGVGRAVSEMAVPLPLSRREQWVAGKVLSKKNI